MKLAEIVNSQESLKNLLAKSLPVKTAYKLGKLALKIQPELNLFNEQKNKLIKDLGVHDEGKDTYTIANDSPNMPKFIEEIAKLTDIDVDLGFSVDKPLEKVTLDDLGDIKIEPKDLINLDWLIA